MTASISTITKKAVTVQSLVSDLGLTGYYPNSWNAFVGQTKAKRQLQTAADSARKRGETCEHVLLESGISGLGKTTLALLMAAELGRSMQIVSGKVNVGQARLLLADMEDGDVLFYEEAHLAVQGGQANAGWLLTLMEQGCIMGPTGPEEQPKITIIGATTDAGRLPETILSRFTVTPELVEYTDIEAEFISSNLALQIFGLDLPIPSASVHEQVARAANNNPRTIRTVLINLRNLAVSENNAPKDGEYDLAEPLSWIGLTADGLTKQAQKYLLALKRDFQGAAGATALKDRLREPGGLAYTERLLMDKGYIAMATGGRTLTATGIRRARQLEAEMIA